MRRDFANGVNDCLISAVGSNIKLGLNSRLFQLHKLLMLQDLLHIIQLFQRQRIHLLVIMMTTLMMLLHLIHQSYSK
jgi:hypothetical protein